MPSSTDIQILAELTEMAHATKFASDCPDWSSVDSTKGERLQLTCPLWIENKITSGLKIEMGGPRSTPAHRPHYGFKALLFASTGGRTWHLGRIEFDPEPPVGPHHINPHDAKDVQPRVTGAHFHSFDDNVAYGKLEALTPKRDLPIAQPLDRIITSYNDILTIIREAYIIPDLWLEEPTWSRTLL